MPDPARGMTLVELLVGMMLGLVATAALGVVLRAGLAASLRAGADAEVAIETAAAVDQLVRDLRSAGYDPRGAGFPAFRLTAADRVELQADLDGDGAIDGNSEERVAYRVAVASRSLQRIVGAQSLPILADVESSGLRLAWFDAAGNALDPDDSATAEAARFVAIEIAATPSGRPVARLHGGAQLRNR
ncbi:MAG: hypothetical protein B6D46_01420 [Polyangiaceae bacterium UTPRO1]|jgi:Tfp pilus assembly protein PilW|nr:prepilin-type N-terminal cleavage/methylation domain-containing protein [Myxococcales bacterium]OQY69004.1 MAG: hypothetical protein B6D46_01420 [Polyangiaceae bacterium UTPRO1]